jgi:hypothetical protein
MVHPVESLLHQPEQFIVISVETMIAGIDKLIALRFFRGAKHAVARIHGNVLITGAL